MKKILNIFIFYFAIIGFAAGATDDLVLCSNDTGNGINSEYFVSCEKEDGTIVTSGIDSNNLQRAYRIDRNNCDNISDCVKNQKKINCAPCPGTGTLPGDAVITYDENESADCRQVFLKGDCSLSNQRTDSTGIYKYKTNNQECLLK